MGLVVGALNLAAERHLSRVGPNWSHRLVEHKFRLVDQQTHPVDWLVLGDSSAAHGIRPDAWEAQTGWTVLNLATVAGLGLTGDAWLLQDYLDRVGRPRGVVVMHTPDVWSRSVSAALVGQIPRPWWQRRQWAPRIAPAWDVVLDQGLSRHLPLYAESGSLVSSVFGHPVPAAMRFHADDQGWARSRPADAEQRAADAVGFRDNLRGAGGRVSGENVRALTVLAGVCARERLPLVVVHAPLWEELAREPEVVRAQDGVEEAVSDVLEGADVIWVRFPEGVPAADLEATVDHLLPEAAGRFTRELAEKVDARVVLE